MKKIILASLIACSMPAAFAKDLKQNALNGNWVVESNLNSPRQQVIKFYNSNSVLVYEDIVIGKKVRYERARVKRALNKTLEMALRQDRTMEPGTFLAVLRTKHP
jgi:hypothetical protein